MPEQDEQPQTHVVEPIEIQRQLPHWYVHTWDRTRAAERSFRLDRIEAPAPTGQRFCVIRAQSRHFDAKANRWEA